MAYGKKAFTRVTLPSDKKYWVDIDTSLTYGEIKTINAGGLEGTEISDKYLGVAIKEWNLDDADGNVLEINQTNIDLLQQDDFLALAEVIKGKAVTDEEKKTS